VIGIGPGDPGHLAPRARQVLAEAEVLAGYRTYLGLLEDDLTEGKEIISTGMTSEIERCRQAIEAARSGLQVAVVCSGDPGIYAMAGLIFELLEQEGLLTELEVQVVPGIPAFSAAAALLGAPLMHDFASISLSDLLTPWEVIEGRLQAAASGDFVLVLYNPRSTKRHWQLEEARRILLQYRSEQTPVGVVRNAGRQDQSVSLTSLLRLDPDTVDMLCTVIVGNSQTRVLGGDRMVTPRGYLGKYGDRLRSNKA
jgi:precorrin-3B C17-methyltransferase